MAGPMPLMAVCLAFVAGIVLGSALKVSLWLWVGLAVVGGLYGFAARRFSAGPPILVRLFAPARRLPAIGLAPLVLLIAVCAGALRYQLAHPAFTPRDLAWYNDRGSAILDGVIISRPEIHDTYTLLRVRISSRAPIEENGGAAPAAAVRGILVVRAALGDTWRYGDAIRVRGSPLTPEDSDDFSYQEYLAVRMGAYSYLPNGQVRLIAHDRAGWLAGSIDALRGRAIALIEQIYPAPESALLSGILLGDDSRLPAAVQEDFRQTGTAHIIAISGFNIGILTALFTRQFSRLLGRWRGALAALIAIAFYVALVGGGASVVRAAIMGGVGIVGSLAGRRQEGINTLAATSAAMCLVQPDWLWDTSFQLSFFATLGLVLYAGPLTAWFIRQAQHFLPEQTARRLAGPIGEYFLFTLAAQAATLPLMTGVFGQISWTSLLANPLVLPIQPALLEIGGISVLLGLVHPTLGRVVGWVAWPCLAYTLRVVEWIGGIPNPAWDVGKISPWITLGYYAVLFGLTFFHRRLTAWTKQIRPALALGVLAALTLVSWQAVLARPDGRLRLTLLDSGSTQTLLIQTPAGGRILVNGGESAASLQTALDRRRPAFTPCRLDLLIVAPRRSQDLLALPETVQRCPPGWTLWPASTAENSALQRLAQTLDDQKNLILPAHAGQSIDLGGGAQLRVLTAGPQGTNFLLGYDRFRALLSFAKDAPAPLQEAVTVLIAAGPQANLSTLNPRVVLAGGEDDDRMAGQDYPGYPVYSSGQHGWIEIATDGEQMWIEVEKQ